MKNVECEKSEYKKLCFAVRNCLSISLFGLPVLLVYHKSLEMRFIIANNKRRSLLPAQY